ncbi:MAG TPA: glycosyltransferase family 39 protein [Thermoanaerobaculia bacterium]|nr:glycosyltransferase family 39 protein [Thermoanaerobaculia bacterium]
MIPERRRAALVAIVFAVIQLPFLGGAFRVDDTNILAIAKQIARAPVDPYGFDFNWTGFPRPAFDILANPPLVPYLLAGWAKVFGWSEIALHSLTVLCGIAAILAFASLARSLGRGDALFPALLAVSPAFFIASHVVMPDIEMLALMIGAAAAAMRYRENGSRGAAAVAFACGFCVVLAKYNGVMLIPVLAAIAIVSPGRRRVLAGIAMSPILGLALWNLFTLQRYGAMHLVALAAERKLNIEETLADLAKRGMHFSIADTIVSLVVITGLAIVPIGWQFVAARRRDWVIALVAGAAAFAIALLRLDYTLSSALLFAFGIAFGVRTFAAVIAERAVIAWVWIASVVAFQIVTIFISVRYVFPLLPVILLLLPATRTIVRPLTMLGVALSACLAIAIAIGDADAASCYRYVSSRLAGRHFWFAGHWGLQWYGAQAGGGMIDVKRPPLLIRGDIVVAAPRAFASLGDPHLAAGTHLEVLHLPCPVRWPVQTISCEAAASWYANEVAGCARYPLYLPFGISAEAEQLEMYVVK